jgi:hypothetical protein
MPGATRNFVFYLDGIADGYVVEQAAPPAAPACSRRSTRRPAASYPDTLLGLFVGGTQFAQTPGPIVLMPSVHLSFGTLSATYSSGQFAIDSANGRGFGSLSQRPASPAQRRRCTRSRPPSSIS